MRRQLGADAVDIDTLEGTCRLAFAAPVPLDWLAVESAAAGARYTLVGLELEATGEVVRGPCGACGEEVAYLVLPGSGQRVELAGEGGSGEVTLRGELLDWDTPHPRLRLLEAR